MDNYSDVFICSKCKEMKHIKLQTPVVCKDCAAKIKVAKNTSTNNAMVPCRAGAVMKGYRCGVAGKNCDGMCMVLLDAQHQ